MLQPLLTLLKTMPFLKYFTNVFQEPSAETSEHSMKDILSRIDSVIKASSQTVKKLEEEYT